MEIDVYENGRHCLLLTSDYSPNHAMINEFQTSFFTCKMRCIELCGKELEGYEVSEEGMFVKLHFTIRNMTNEILGMFREDFEISCDDGAPYEAEECFDAEKQFPDEYALKPQEERTGCLVFIIASATKKICLSYTEYFDDESEGKTYRLKYKIK